MLFNGFETEPVTLEKEDGRKLPTDALVTDGEVLLPDSRLPVESGDVIARELPSGLSERLEVLDPGFIRGVPPHIPPHYQAKVRNAAAKQARTHNIVHNYNAHQVAAMGPGATAIGNTLVSNQVTQTWTEQERNSIELELLTLVRELASRAGDSPENAIEVGVVGAAQQAVAAGDQNAFMAKIKSFGAKSLQLIEQLGLKYLELRTKQYIGLPPGD